MSNILILNQPRVDVGLQTSTYTVPSDGIYNVQVQLTENPPSGLSVVVKKNSVTQFTAPVITPTQVAQQFKYSAPFAAADVIDVVLATSQSNPNTDYLLNSVKSNVSIGQGA